MVKFLEKALPYAEAGAGIATGNPGLIAAGAGSIIGANASGKAAKQQVNAAGDANARLQQNYLQTRTDFQPYAQTGNEANTELQYLLGLNPAGLPGGNAGAAGSLVKPFDMNDFQADPGYDFRMQEGLKALQRTSAARGGTASGAALKGITNYAQGAASQEFGNAYARYNQNQNNLFSRLSGQQGVGFNANTTMANAGQNAATGIANNITSAGAARAAGTIGAANSYATGLNNVTSALQTPSGGGNDWDWGDYGYGAW